jgi:hypothetical protein
MGVRFELNRSAEEQIKRSAELKAFLYVKARDAAGTAEGIGQGVAGSYRVDVADGDDGAVELRANSGGINAAGWIDFGATHLPARAPLRRGVESAGLRLTGGGRNG